MNTFKAPLISALAVAAIVGCGGGGDNNAGAPVALNATPSKITLTNQVVLRTGEAIGDFPCGTGQQLIYLNGGAGPYDIYPPAEITVDKRQVNRGESFVATLSSGACLTDIPILIIDKNKNQTTVTVSTTRQAAS